MNLQRSNNIPRIRVISSFETGNERCLNKGTRAKEPNDSDRELRAQRCHNKSIRSRRVRFQKPRLPLPF